MVARVLGVMSAVDLEAALEAQNAVETGLTTGIHSLKEDEVRRWCERVEAGVFT